MPSRLRTLQPPGQVLAVTGSRSFMLVLCMMLAGHLIQAPATWGQPFRADYADEIPLVWRGFVILNGHYISAPYRIDLAGDELTINDFTISKDQLDLTQFEEERAELQTQSDASYRRSRSEHWSERRSWATPPPSFELMDIFWDACHSTAQMDGVIVLTDGERPLLLEHSRSAHDFLVTLLNKSGVSLAELGDLEPSIVFVDDRERVAWQKAVDQFQPTPEFVDRARLGVGIVLAANDSAERVVKASLWIDKVSYPLTLFAMVTVVFAFGHLLTHKPCLETGQGLTTISPETRKVVLKSLLIFALLSAIDLIWTLAANASGSMREMNPIGNEFIQDPASLVLFKTMAVSITIALLYALHRRPIAQVASWWSCLVLTLLTARWLTFNSMFM